MFEKKFQIGVATIVMMVILRLSLGFHFLYEGVWKIAHPEFSAEGFLLQAKGPAAWIFYAMLPDVDGHQRLKIEKLASGEVILGSQYVDAWNNLKEKVVRKYRLNDEQKHEIDKICQRYRDSARYYLLENQEDIAAYFGALDHFEARKAAGNNGAAFHKKRAWNEMQKLRGEVGVWLTELDAMGEDYQQALWNVLSAEQKEMGPLPVPWTMAHYINFAVTYGLTAIGLCLILGLFTRPAALGGGVFMFFVVLTQPAWPTIYPPAPPVAGHALLVNKDFVEMVALFLVAVTAAGRWGGLDYFVENYIVKQIRLAAGLARRVCARAH